MMGKIRRLGFGELRMHLMHALLAGTTQGALGIRVAGPLDVDRLRAVAAQLRQAHQMLRLVVQEEDGEFHFAAQADDAQALVELRAAPARMGDGMAQLEAENAVPLDAARHTWRIAVVPYGGQDPVHDIILVMHHAIMDAGGADYLLNAVLSGLAGETPAPAFDAATVPPSAESACLVASSWDDFAATQQAVMQRTQALQPPAHRTAAALHERRTVGQAFKLTADECAALSAFCADAGVSFNSYVSAALMAAVCAHDPARAGVALYTAVSLRRLCPAAGDQPFGCYLSVVPTFHDAGAGASGLVALAREHQHALQAAFLEYGRPPRDYTAADVVAGMQRLARIDRFVNDIGFTYAESSLKAAYGPLRLLHSHVLSNRAAGNVALVLHGLKLNGDVFFTLIHTEPLQDAEWAQAVGAQLRRLLRDVRVPQPERQ